MDDVQGSSNYIAIIKLRQRTRSENRNTHTDAGRRALAHTHTRTYLRIQRAQLSYYFLIIACARVRLPALRLDHTPSWRV